MASKLYGELSKICSAGEAGKLKTSLAKYSIKFNDFAVQNASALKKVFEAVRQTLHITVCEKVCGQTMKCKEFSIFFVSRRFTVNEKSAH